MFNSKAKAALRAIDEQMTALYQEKRYSQTLAILNDLGRKLINSDRCSFWCVDEKNDTLWTMEAHNVEKIVIPKGSGLVGYAIDHNEVLIVNKPYKDSRFNAEVDKQTGYKTKSILVMPVTNSKNQVIGAYQAINKRHGKFKQTDVKSLMLPAVMLGKILESQLLYNSAVEDQLTGLKNRRGFYDFYETYISSNEYHKHCVIMCDIDFFKKFNDTYGHNAGDAVLRHVANVFYSNIRVDDGVFRWGGEEFIFLLPNTDLETAVTLAEKLRKTIEDSVCLFEDLVLRVTMSFGVHTISPTLNVEDNVKAADEKLYQAKENGRNQVRK